MRTFLIAAIILVVIAIFVIASPFVNVTQNEAGSPPSIEAGDDGITATAGEAPSFEVETGSVKMGDDSIEIETADAGDDESTGDEVVTAPAAP